MNRYVVIANVYEELASGGQANEWLVVDLSSSTVVARCGSASLSSVADKVAQALNGYDGGPL